MYYLTRAGRKFINEEEPTDQLRNTQSAYDKWGEDSRKVRADRLAARRKADRIRREAAAKKKPT